MSLTGRSRPALRRRLACAAARAVPGAHIAQPGAYANFRRFVDEGTTAFNARSDYTHKVTLPNRMTLSTGRPVLQTTGQLNTVHRFYTNH